jgi:hypothetical protein
MTEQVVAATMTPEEALAAYSQAIKDIVGAENVIDVPME